MTVPYFEILRALSPEAMLVVAAFGALTLDLAGLRRAEPGVRNRTIGTVALVGLLWSFMRVLRVAAWQGT